MRDDYDDVRAAFDRAEPVYPADFDPRTPQGCGPDDPPSDPGFDPDEALAQACALFPLNDYGNGQRVKSYFGADCLFVPRVSWFVWTGKLWEQDDDQLETRRHAQQISAKISREAVYIRLEDWENDKIDAGDLAREDVAEIKEIPPSKRDDDQKARLKELEQQVERGDALKKKLARSIT